MQVWQEILKNNDFIRVKQYLRSGVNPNQTNENNESVLMLAIQYRCDDEILKLLIKNNANLLHKDNYGVNIFDMAIEYNLIWLVRQLVESKLYEPNTTTRGSGFTPLMCAASYGRTEILTYLLQEGADKNTEDIKGFKAIDFAKKLNKKHIISILNHPN